MNRNDLNLQVQRAIEQSNNDTIASVKIVSSNQLKSGDLSIKTASSSEVETLRQFADDWAHCIGSGTAYRGLDSAYRRNTRHAEAKTWLMSPWRNPLPRVMQRTSQTRYMHRTELFTRYLSSRNSPLIRPPAYAALEILLHVPRSAFPELCQPIVCSI